MGHGHGHAEFVLFPAGTRFDWGSKTAHCMPPSKVHSVDSTLLMGATFSRVLHPRVARCREQIKTKKCGKPYTTSLSIQKATTTRCTSIPQSWNGDVVKAPERNHKLSASKVNIYSRLIDPCAKSLPSTPAMLASKQAPAPTLTQSYTVIRASRSTPEHYVRRTTVVKSPRNAACKAAADKEKPSIAIIFLDCYGLLSVL